MIRARPRLLQSRGSSAHASGYAILVAVALCGAILYAARDLMIPLTIAALLSFIGGSALRRLEQLGFSRRLSSAVLALALLISFFGGGAFLTAQLSAVADRLPLYSANISRKIAGIEKSARSWGERFSFKSLGTSRLAEQREAVPESEAGSTVWPALPAVTVIGPLLLHALAIGGFVIVLALFLAVYRDDIRDRIIRLAGERNVHVTAEALDEAAARVSTFLWTQLLVNMLFGAIVGIALLALGLEFALLWGTLLCLLRFVPLVGTILGGAIPMLFAFSAYETSHMALAVGGVVLITDFLIAQFVEPLVIGRRTGLSPPAVLVAIFVWTFLWGASGLILAIPLTACIAVAGRYVPQLSFFTILLSDERPLDVSMQLYHRALSHRELATDSWLEEQVRQLGINGFIVEAFLPALCLGARQRDIRKLAPQRFRLLVSALEAALVALRAKTQVSKEEGPDASSPVIVATALSESAEGLVAQALGLLSDSLPARWLTLERPLVPDKFGQALQGSGAALAVICMIHPGRRRLRQYLESARCHSPATGLIVFQALAGDEVTFSRVRPDATVRSAREFLACVSGMLLGGADRAMLPGSPTRAAGNQ